MAAPTLGIVAVLHLVTAAAFLTVARILGRRDVLPEDRLAARAFIVWWAAMGAYMALRGLVTGYASLTAPAATVFLIARAIGIPLLVVGVWGLVFHILYLFTGNRGLAWPLATAYAAIGALFALAGFAPVPQTVEVHPWYVRLQGEGESLLYRAVYGTLGLSIIGSALAYLTILPRVEDRLQRLRVKLVSGSIGLWVLSGLAAFFSTSDLAKSAVLIVLGLGTAAAVLVAYRPPKAVVRWAYGLPRPNPEERHAEMRERAEALV